MPHVFTGVAQFSYGRPLTPNDTPDANSRLDGAQFIHCKTAAGLVTVTQKVTAAAVGVASRAAIAPTALTTYQFQIGVGEVWSVGASWTNVNSTGTTATGLSALH